MLISLTMTKKERKMSGITIVMLIVYAVVFGGGSIFLVAKSMSKKTIQKAKL